jgi:hypothetical protein
MLSVSPVEIRPADATQVDDLLRLVNEAYEVLVFQRSIG